MATTVEFHAATGKTLTIELYPHGSDTIANGAGGDSATEYTNKKGVYHASISEVLTGMHDVVIKEGVTIIANYHVNMANDGEIHRCGDWFYADLVTIDGETTPVTYFKDMMKSIVSGEVMTDAGNTTLTFKTDLTSLVTDYYGNTTTGGFVLVFTSGTTNEGQSRRVVAYNATTKFVTVEAAFSSVPVAGDDFILVGRIEV